MPVQERAWSWGSGDKVGALCGCSYVPHGESRAEVMGTEPCGPLGIIDPTLGLGLL